MSALLLFYSNAATLPTSTSSTSASTCTPIFSPILGVCFSIFLFCHPCHSVVFPLSFDDDHNILPTRPYSAFLSIFSFLSFSFPFSLPYGGTKRCGPSRSSSKSKQADSNSKSLLARSIACSVGPFLFLSNPMKAERERFVANICACYAYISRSWSNRSIDRSSSLSSCSRPLAEGETYCKR